ncbi:MAG: CHAT domain-containing protein [Rhodothermales bacterium]
MSRDVLIRIDPDGDAFVATLREAGGDRSARFRLPMAIDRMDDMLAGTESAILRGGATRGEREAERMPAISLEALGQSLFSSLFGEALMPIFDDAWPGQVFDPETAWFRPADEWDDPHPLRIMLHINPTDPRVAPILRLPWELSQRPGTGEYLSIAEPYTLFRYLEVGGDYAPTPVMLPLRVLVVLSNPTNVQPLDLDAERKKIEASWGKCRGVQVEYLEEATLDALRSRFRQTSYHVLHYMGHGAFDDPVGKGGLIMEGQDGRSEFVDSDTFAGAIWRSDDPLQLVYLNACNTAQSSEQATDNIFAGTAARMVQGGVIPAVLAMQFSISDRAAIVFSEAFYKAITDEQPADVAVAIARRAIAAQIPGSFEWITPVLYMRSLSGKLFNFLSLYG